MQAHPPILSYTNKRGVVTPVKIEYLPAGFRIVIPGMSGENIIALAGWSAVWVFLVAQLLLASELIGIAFLGAVVFCASIAVVLSIQGLRKKTVEYIDGELHFAFPAWFWTRHVQCSVSRVRDLYAACETIQIRLLDESYVPACQLGSAENVHATLALLRMLLPKRVDAA